MGNEEKSATSPTPGGPLTGIRRYLFFTSIVAILVICGGFGFRYWHAQQPRAASLRVLDRLVDATARNDATALMQLVVLPPSLARLTEPEQQRQVREALRGEVSTEGLKLLAEDGEFGPALKIFPAEIARWAAVSGVNPTNCIAWRMGEEPLRTEVVLSPEKPPFRLVRCNNVFVKDRE